MRVLWLSHFVPWPPTGMGMLQRGYNLLCEAAKRNAVHLVALSDRRLISTEATGQARIELEKFCAEVDLLPRDGLGPLGDRGIALLRSLATGRSYDVEWMRSGALDRRLAELARTRRYDLVHLESVGLAPHLRHFPGVPSVLAHQNVESFMVNRRAARERVTWRRLLFQHEAGKLARLECSMRDRAAIHIVVSSIDAGRLEAVVGPVETRVVPNGVDVGYFAPQRPLGHADGGMIFAGPMNWYPNLDAMLFFVREIWPALLRDRPDRRMVITGRGAPAELREAADGTRLRVTGQVPDVRPYIDAASIYLCPIRDGGGTRLKVLDALAMAKPLVATDLAVEGLDLVEGLHYLRAETAEEYVAQVRRLEDEPALRLRLAVEGRKLAEEVFAWPSIGRRQAAAHDEAVSPATRVPERDTRARRASARRPGAAGPAVG